MERGLTCLVLKMSQSEILGVTWYHSTGSLGSSIFYHKNDRMNIYKNWIKCHNTPSHRYLNLSKAEKKLDVLCHSTNRLEIFQVHLRQKKNTRTRFKFD